MKKDDTKERRIAYGRAYAAKHREEAKARAKAWYYANKERALATRKAYRETHDQSEYQKQYRQDHLDELREYDRKRAKSPERKEYQKRFAHHRRVSLRGLPHESIDRIELYYAHQGLCGLCGQPVSIDEFEVDHIIPVSNGGGHVFGNLHVAHPKCNRRKGNRIPDIIYSV